MFGLSWLKIGGGFAAMLAFGALIYFAQDRFEQKAVADAARHCNAAAASPDKSLDECLDDVAATIEAHRRAELCDAKLGAPDNSLFAIRGSCSTEVKTLVAERDALSVSLASANETIEQLISNQSQAVERAEQRATQALSKAKRNEDVLRAVPRDAGGLIRCDASCLRDLAD